MARRGVGLSCRRWRWRGIGIRVSLEGERLEGAGHMAMYWCKVENAHVKLTDP